MSTKKNFGHMLHCFSIHRIKQEANTVWTVHFKPTTEYSSLVQLVRSRSGSSLTTASMSFHCLIHDSGFRDVQKPESVRIQSNWHNICNGIYETQDTIIQFVNQLLSFSLVDIMISYDIQKKYDESLNHYSISTGNQAFQRHHMITT